VRTAICLLAALALAGCEPEMTPDLVRTLLPHGGQGARVVERNGAWVASVPCDVDRRLPPAEVSITRQEYLDAHRRSDLGHLREMIDLQVSASCRLEAARKNLARVKASLQALEAMQE
jgi:hypothetical protein